MMFNTKKITLVGLMTGLITGGAILPAQAAVDSEVAFILNSLLFLIGGFLVMWMAAGFCMLEAGLVRTKNVATMCLKNISLYAIAGILYFLIGYNLMYSGVDGGFIGSLSLWSASETAAQEAVKLDGGYASASDWFFQMVFVATAASIVSGTLAERIKLFPFLAFVVVLTGFIYPIQGAWTWGAGWLSAAGFSDFAGSTIVHSVGGWAALTGAIILGARQGKYSPTGQVRPIPGSSLTLATLGTFILWLGWFGFNGASQLALGSAIDAVAVSQIFANTNMAAAGGVVAALALTKLLYKKVDLTMVLNGALAGLVSITAEPLTPTIGQAILIGAVGGALVVFTVPLLDKFKIDDVVGAIPVHLICGIWGTLAVPLTNDGASFVTQVMGVAAIGAFVAATSIVMWMLLKYTVGIRVSAEDESRGGDLAELGMEAYPEFGHGSQKI
ncbi:ammonium transporter [Paremcibacter congregatus]|uniref:Ammonium transporter n=2 Tax=Paremcibacter congregatus TaxID=2043170 RepID=A0A2G4YP56_9PROT|nr:ammonium transporter [Paremcibacter congregatus]PHZ84109.1 ammonium transporter [Paremcibacter congregatus]QDE25831.1 ammonium transporter [Paremcibacter congregatus]